MGVEGRSLGRVVVMLREGRGVAWILKWNNTSVKCCEI